MSRITKSRAVTVGVTASLAAAALVGVAGSASAAAPGAAGTAVPALGTDAGGNVVSVTGTGFRDAITNAVAVETPKAVVGTAPTCTATSGVTSTNVTTWSVVSATRITLTMPAGAVPAASASIKAVLLLPRQGGHGDHQRLDLRALHLRTKPVTAPTTGDLFTPASGPTFRRPRG